jgi:hypothetical protein
MLVWRGRIKSKYTINNTTPHVGFLTFKCSVLELTQNCVVNFTDTEICAIIFPSACPLHCSAQGPYNKLKDTVSDCCARNEMTRPRTRPAILHRVHLLSCGRSTNFNIKAFDCC